MLNISIKVCNHNVDNLTCHSRIIANTLSISVAQQKASIWTIAHHYIVSLRLKRNVDLFCFNYSLRKVTCVAVGIEAAFL